MHNGPILVDSAAALLKLHPRLQRPAPPAPLGRSGRAIDPARQRPGFWQLDTKTWRRRLVDDPSRLVGPLPFDGDCLPMLGRPPFKAWVDPDLPAEEGDLVLIDFRNGVAQMLHDGRQSPGWWTRFSGKRLGTSMGKILHYYDGHAYLLAGDEHGATALALGSSVILGVVRCIQPSRESWPYVTIDGRRIAITPGG